MHRNRFRVAGNGLDGGGLDGRRFHGGDVRSRWRNVPNVRGVDRGVFGGLVGRLVAGRQAADGQQRQAPQAQGDAPEHHRADQDERQQGHPARDAITHSKTSVRLRMLDHDADPPPAAAAPFWYIKIGCWPF